MNSPNKNSNSFKLGFKRFKHTTSYLTDDQIGRIKCVNRRCRYGRDLIPAKESVCDYYDVTFKKSKQVCKRCYAKCLNYYKQTADKFMKGECVLDVPKPCYATHMVIDSSSSSSDDDYEDQPSTSREGLPVDKDLEDLIDVTVDFFIEENKDLLKAQLDLCNTKVYTQLLNQKKIVSELDQEALSIDKKIADLRRTIYAPYRCQVTSVGCVDINELMEKEEKEKHKKNEEESQKNKEHKKNEEEHKKNEEEHKKNVEEHKKKNEKHKENKEEHTKKIEKHQGNKEHTKKNEKYQENKEEHKKNNEKHNENKEEHKTNKEEYKNKTGKDDNTKDKDIITGNFTYNPIPSDLPMVGQLEYPPLVDGQLVYAMKFSLIEPWSKCQIKAIINEDYMHVMFDNDEKLVTTKEISYFKPCLVQFPVGTRVIAMFIGSSTKMIDSLYAGVVAEPPKLLNNFRYLIFFDNGSAQYRHHKDIRLIVNKSSQVWNDVHSNLNKDFLRSYLEKYPERQMVRLSKDQFVRVQFELQWYGTKVLEVDASLVRLSFIELKKIEWIYRGSSRLWNIFEKQCKSEKGTHLRQYGLAYLNKPFVEYSSFEEPTKTDTRTVVRKSSNTTNSKHTTNGSNIIDQNKNFKVIHLNVRPHDPVSRNYVVHNCSHACIEWTKYSYEKTKPFSMLSTPLFFGFTRCLYNFKDDGSNRFAVIYRAPCGRSIRNMQEMHQYLIITSSEMTIDQFDFSSWVRPMAKFRTISAIKFQLDISEGKEFRNLPFVNTINVKKPPAMEYITTRRAMPGVNLNLDSNFLCGCDCTDNCQDRSKCACWKLTFEGQKCFPNLYKDPDPEVIGYDFRRLPERVLTGIYECNKTCKCKSTCLNRVVQHPLSQNLQLFMTEKKGWGVRCINDIPQGSFICIYVGCLLTETDANEGGKNYGDEYLAELDYIEVVEKFKEDYESDVVYSDQETSDTNTNNDSCPIYESSDEDFQGPTDGKRMVSEFALRLRKRKKPKLEVKKDRKSVKNQTKSNGREKNIPVVQKPMREYFGTNESVYIMDAKTSGNIGRYFNHSCFPNIFVQNVFVDTHDPRFPWISFFALHYIRAGTELTWDYSYDVGSVPGKVMKCHCETAHCRGRLL